MRYRSTDQRTQPIIEMRVRIEKKRKGMKSSDAEKWAERDEEKDDDDDEEEEEEAEAPKTKG